MKIIASLSFLFTVVVSNCAGQTIIELAAADGKYDSLLEAIRVTPDVLDDIVDSFPVSKWISKILSSSLFRSILPLLLKILLLAIFAPTDNAFRSVSTIVSGLSEDGLASVLETHVVRGVYTSADFVDSECLELTSLSGSSLRVLTNGTSVMVNDAMVIQADIVGDGGIIHGIDKVILPGTFQSCSGSGYGKGSKKSTGSSKGSKKASGSSKGTKKSSSGKGSASKGTKRSSGSYSRRMRSED
eukprot:scaffold4736_cov105-Cylindrotheca_fusiformis.AAC.8